MTEKDGETVDQEALEPELGCERGPLRLCAVTRVQKSPDALIRFVPDPAGCMVPDLARRLPGRGVWVDATRTALQEAVRRGVFAKSLKRPVNVPDDLPGLVENLLRRRLVDALSLANKAGLVVAGFTKVGTLIEARRAALVLHAKDGSDDGTAKLDGRLRAMLGPAEAEQRICKEMTTAEMSLALGRLNVVHAAASEGGACRRILQEAGRLRRFQSGDG